MTSADVFASMKSERCITAPSTRPGAKALGLRHVRGGETWAASRARAPRQTDDSRATRERSSPMPYRACSTPGCGTLHEGTGMCPTCRAKAEQQRRPDGSPYRTKAHRDARETVLARNPRCVCPGDCGKHTGWCGATSTIADHWPTERRDLVAMGLNPDDPTRMRGICKPCHDAKTARTNPAGWNATR